MNISKVISGVPIINKVRTDYLVRTYQSSSSCLSADTLELSPAAKLESQSEAILSRFHKFNIKDYNSLSRVEKSIIRNTSEAEKEAAEDSLKMGMKVKEHLDKRYGEDGYVFCSIGTSMSGVARVLEFMGVETKYLPISSLRYYYQDDKYKELGKDFPIYGQFLREQDLTKENIEASDKHYLFFDYTATGYSLKVFRKIMKEYFGIEGKNVHFLSGDYECYAASAKKIDPEQYAVDYVEKYMIASKIEDYCGVAHLPIYEMSKLEECKSYESAKAKRFNFLIIDELKRKGLLKYNAKNRKSL